MQKRLLRLPLVSLLASALLLPAATVQASEVVKLARLVITGKRLSAERGELVATQKITAPVAVARTTAAPELARTAVPSPVQTATASAQDVAGRIPVARSRGTLSFF